jgi:hypothetical protein
MTSCEAMSEVEMFELGKKYRVTMVVSDGAKEHLNCEVIDFEMPVVKFRQNAKEIIVNVSSPHIVKAIRQEEQAQNIL